MAHVTEADFEETRGGMWIMPDGRIVPVRRESEHVETIQRHGFPFYDAAYEAGWVHTRFRLYPAEFSATFTNATTAEALMELAAILRHDRTANVRDVYIYREKAEREAEPGEWETFQGDARRDKAARYIMKFALAKNAAKLAAERQLEAA